MPISSAPPSGGTPASGIEHQLVQVRNAIRTGDLARARKISDAMLAAQPHHPGVLIQRSRLESVDDNYRLARGYTLSAYRAGIRNKRQCMQLLRRLKTFNLIPELHDFIPRIPPTLSEDPDVALLLSLLMQVLNQPQSALQHVQAAAARHPGSSALQSEIGLAMTHLGRFDEAERHFMESLRINPGHAPAWWHLSRLPRHGGGSIHVDALKRETSRANAPANKALLAYALHRELDGAGHHADAADALDLACKTMRQVVDYSAEDNKRLFSMLKALPADGSSPPSMMSDAPFTPVFIVGMHRSGTTLLEHLLSGHTEICAGGELYDFTSQLRLAADHHCSTELDHQIIQASGGFDYASIGAGYLDSVAYRYPGQRFVTDKLPSNFLNLGFILRALPGARILHMSRDPIETCFSSLREPFSETTCRYSYDQVELADYYREYFALMQHWRQRFPGRIHDVTYAALAADPASELKRVAAHLGVEYQSAMLEAEANSQSVNTASAVQVRRKPSLPLRPKWQPYSEYLTPLVWRLSEIGQRY
ncbi:sulfotransferase [Luteimonas aestuarii]|uniref:Sulfotransferase n=1 Tax=Luteimonas aestuarii TaxID=453837 RepID=A0A4V6PLN5_9GAMM|nr:sulfotransferase [Luteimonas aestuarii]TDK24457.1 sulfotransferase [Luteimonas aestuarii]